MSKKKQPATWGVLCEELLPLAESKSVMENLNPKRELINDNAAVSMKGLSTKLKVMKKIAGEGDSINEDRLG